MTGPGKIAINGHTENSAAVDFINIKFPVEIDGHFEVNFLFLLPGYYKHTFGLINMERRMIKLCPF